MPKQIPNKGLPLATVVLIISTSPAACKLSIAALKAPTPGKTKAED